MNSRQIALVKQSWKVFRNLNPETVGDLFYSKLFADTPDLRKMFPSNMNQQYQKLLDMLNITISHLDKLDSISDEISEITQRHEQYGVKPLHYTLVGNALMWTLQKGLGEDYTEELQNAWEECYKLISELMLNNSHGN